MCSNLILMVFLLNVWRSAPLAIGWSKRSKNHILRLNKIAQSQNSKRSCCEWIKHSEMPRVAKFSKASKHSLEITFNPLRPTPQSVAANNSRVTLHAEGPRFASVNTYCDWKSLAATVEMKNAYLLSFSFLLHFTAELQSRLCNFSCSIFTRWIPRVEFFFFVLCSLTKLGEKISRGLQTPIINVFTNSWCANTWLNTNNMSDCLLAQPLEATDETSQLDELERHQWAQP